MVLRSSSGGQSTACQRAPARPTALAASQQLVVSERKVSSSPSSSGDGTGVGRLACYLVAGSLSPLYPLCLMTRAVVTSKVGCRCSRVPAAVPAAASHLAFPNTAR